MTRRFLMDPESDVALSTRLTKELEVIAGLAPGEATPEYDVSLARVLALFRRATKQPIAPDVLYEEQLVRAAGVPASEYPIDATQRNAARSRRAALPHPSSRLLLRAPLDT